jgi:hypothetical protein
VTPLSHNLLVSLKTHCLNLSCELQPNFLTSQNPLTVHSLLPTQRRLRDNLPLGHLVHQQVVLRAAMARLGDGTFDARCVLQVLVLVPRLGAHLVDAFDGVLDGLVELAFLLLREAVVRVVLQAVDESVPRPTDQVDVVHVVGENEVGLLDQGVGNADALVVSLLGALAAAGGHGRQDEEDGVEKEHRRGG